MPRDSAKAPKILILKPSSLGDVVQAMPVLRLLKRHLPQSEIHWWIQSNLAGLLEGDPDLAGLVLFERKRWARPQHWPEMVASVRWMREQSFDWVIDLQCLARSGTFAWLANGGLAVGLDEVREGARGFYDLVARRPSFHTHAVDWYLRVLPLLGVPVTADFEWLPPRPAAAARLLEKWPDNGLRRVVFQPGARWLNKRWPVEHYAELAQRFTQAHGDFQVVVLGGSEDRPLGEAISRGAPGRCLDLTGRLSLGEMVEWVRRCEAMVSNDTGPMHVAAALGKPLVALFGPTEPCRTGPYGQLGNVLQLDLACVPCLESRCHHSVEMECLRALSPTAVLAALESRVCAR